MSDSSDAPGIVDEVVLVNGIRKDYGIAKLNRGATLASTGKPIQEVPERVESTATGKRQNTARIKGDSCRERWMSTSPPNRNVWLPTVYERVLYLIVIEETSLWKCKRQTDGRNTLAETCSSKGKDGTTRKLSGSRATKFALNRPKPNRASFVRRDEILRVVKKEVAPGLAHRPAGNGEPPDPVVANWLLNRWLSTRSEMRPSLVGVQSIRLKNWSSSTG